MIPCLRLICILFFLGATTAIFAQIEPQGMLLYQEPATTYIEALQYRSFRQENPLYATVITSAGRRKQLNARGVVAVLPDPPASFDAYFASTAQAAIAKIEALVRKYPAVAPQLEQTLGKWEHALKAFHQLTVTPTTASVAPSPLALRGGVFKDARINRATTENVTVTHATGVTTLPIAELTADQVLALNRNSDKVQLPLGIARPVSRAVGQKAEEDTLTLRIAAAGDAAVTFCAEKVGVSSRTFTIWTFFVVLPGLVLLLLLGLIFFARRSAVIRIKKK